MRVLDLTIDLWIDRAQTDELIDGSGRYLRVGGIGAVGGDRSYGIGDDRSSEIGDIGGVVGGIGRRSEIGIGSELGVDWTEFEFESDRIGVDI